MMVVTHVILHIILWAVTGFFLEKIFRGGKAPLTKKVEGQMLPKAAMPPSGPVGGLGASPPRTFREFWRWEVPSEHFSEEIFLAL